MRGMRWRRFFLKYFSHICYLAGGFLITGIGLLLSVKAKEKAPRKGLLDGSGNRMKQGAMCVAR